MALGKSKRIEELCRSHGELSWSTQDVSTSNWAVEMNPDGSMSLTNQPSSRQNPLCILKEIPAKKIKWSIRDIFESRCWRCRHWIDLLPYEGYSKIAYCCEYNSLVGFSSQLGKIEPEKIRRSIQLNIMLAHNIIKTIKLGSNKEEFVVVEYDSIAAPKEFFIDECPVFSETQDFHEWKESHTFKIKDLVL